MLLYDPWTEGVGCSGGVCICVAITGGRTGVGRGWNLPVVGDLSGPLDGDTTIESLRRVCFLPSEDVPVMYCGALDVASGDSALFGFEPFCLF